MRVLSGIQPTGTVHLGNYLGAIKSWVETQHDDAFYCVVDLHALTTDISPSDLTKKTMECAATLFAAGLNPHRSSVFVQSQVPFHTQLSWILECVASFGELRRMTQFKEKADRQELHRVGLFTYPILMASDILLYNSEHVPVGADQQQHLELAREIAIRFNSRFGDTFTVPEGVIPTVAARVMDLQNPLRKMSKSVASPLGTITIFDSPEEVTKKIKKAVTDTDAVVDFDWETKPGLSNLLEILSACTGAAPADLAKKYTRYGDLKNDVSEAIIEELRPIQTKFNILMNDTEELRRLLSLGSSRANEVASKTYERASAAVGLLR